MDIDRIKSVLSSKGVVNVEYNGMPVWVVDIDRNDNMVLIEGIEDSSFQEKVNPDDLEEPVQ